MVVRRFLLLVPCLMFVVRASFRVVGCCSFLGRCLLFVVLVRAGCRLFLLVESCRLLAYCLLIAGCWLLVVYCLLFSCLVPCFLLVIVCCLLIVD